MENNEITNFTDLKTLIDAFCDIILIKGDKFNNEKAKYFIDNLSNNDKLTLNLDLNDMEAKPQLEFILQDKIIEYLQLYDDLTANEFERPFEFDSAGNYQMFFKMCSKHYQEKNSGAQLPEALKYSLEYIHNASEHYKVFSNFYDVRSKETAGKIINEMKVVASKEAKEAVREATAEQAKKLVNDEIKTKMPDVSRDVSSTSVTILGIFSGVVLTVVAGLFYSSSVLDNINSANFFRLLSIAALVGLVCLNLLTTMFIFVEKIGKQTGTLRTSFKVTKAINIFLILVVIIGIILQFMFPSHELNTTQNITNITEQVLVYGQTENTSQIDEQTQE